ncbi:Farnesoate epoxidase [Orchesella cincta]|uniref:Farnesoate epoxidase n=1 Tax=Orchesella cincta TaxID=48709 RepID=A0A1D2MIA4_ORCCI|nr:Farnesoate epoxidase [Orchesella cincta]
MVFLLPVSEILVAVVVLLVYLTFFYKRKHPKYPPGPSGLPLIGNVHQLGKNPSLTLMKWKEEFGKIFSIKLGIDDAVVINDPKLIKELFSDVASSGRIQNAFFLCISQGPHGIINTEGKNWEEQRRFVLRTLRDFGFAKSSMEGLILDEVKGVLDWFDNAKGSPVSCNRLFNAAVVNSLWHLVSGQKNKVNGNNPQESDMLQKSDKLMIAIEQAANTGLAFAPFLRHIAPNLSGWTSLLEAVRELNQHSEKAIMEHKSKLDPNCPEDLIDHYLIEMNKTKDPKSSFFQTIGEKNLQAVVIDLFEAGNETTSNTLLWSMLYLCHHPGVQQKLIEEIHNVVGKDRQPSLSDRASLPYTEAVLLEVLRKSSLVPMGVLHRMLKDTMFEGYLLPKNTIIIPNLHASLNDPEIWGDPEHFRPERFLSEDGKKVIRNDALIPFSIGRRVCIGESFAKDTLLLFIASIFQKFELHPDPKNPKPNFEPNPGIISLPKPFKVVVKRHTS